MSYTDFDASDAAIEAINGQFLVNKAITVQYAFKKDGKGEGHGTAAERLLTAQARKNNALAVGARPHPAPRFGSAPPVPGFQAPYQPGQIASVLAPQAPPPPGFAPNQMMPPQMGMLPGMGMAPPSALMPGYGRRLPSTSSWIGFPSGGMPPPGMMPPGVMPPPPVPQQPQY
jgi:splicing factor 3B subunit 4